MAVVECAVWLIFFLYAVARAQIQAHHVPHGVGKMQTQSLRGRSRPRQREAVESQHHVPQRESQHHVPQREADRDPRCSKNGVRCCNGRPLSPRSRSDLRMLDALDGVFGNLVLH